MKWYYFSKEKLVTSLRKTGMTEQSIQFSLDIYGNKYDGEEVINFHNKRGVLKNHSHIVIHKNWCIEVEQ